jgi:hypothetical protein
MYPAVTPDVLQNAAQAAVYFFTVVGIAMGVLLGARM